MFPGAAGTVHRPEYEPEQRDSSIRMQFRIVHHLHSSIIMILLHVPRSRRLRSRLNGDGDAVPKKKTGSRPKFSISEIHLALLSDKFSFCLILSLNIFRKLR